MVPRSLGNRASGPPRWADTGPQSWGISAGPCHPGGYAPCRGSANPGHAKHGPASGVVGCKAGPCRATNSRFTWPMTTTGDMAKVVPLGCNSVGQAEGVDVGFVMAQQVGAQLVGK
jgi:hypothetical protein